MTIDAQLISNFEDLSDDIIISIIEYLSLEDFITIFGKLNSRLACIIFDHPWTHHQLNIQIMDDKTLKSKLDFIENMKLTSRISSINIRPFSIYRSIEIFHQYKSLDNFMNLRALSLNNITLEETESIFTSENLSKLIYLTRLHINFSFGVESNDYSLRLERLISKILLHPSLRHCIIHTARSIDFSQIESSSPVEYLDIDCCSFQSLYTLFEFTPSLRHLTASITIPSESRIQKISIPPLLNSIKLYLSICAFDDLTIFLKRFPKLQKLNIITYSVIESSTFTSSWFKLITEYLPALIKFKRESNVALENIEEYMESFRWPNGWQLEEKSVPNGANYSRITIINIRY